MKLLKNPLLFYISKYRFYFFSGMFALLVTNILDGFYPMILKRGIDQMSNHEPLSEILKTALMFLVLMSSLAVTRFYWRIFFGRYHTEAAEHLRKELFSHLLTLGPSFYQKNQIGEILSLMTNDIQSFRGGIGSAILVLADGFMIIIIILPMMIYLSPSWTWKTLIFIPLVPFLIKKVTKIIFERFKIQQDRLSELSGFSQETVAGIRVIKSFAQEKNRSILYKEQNKNYENCCNRVARYDALFMPVMEFGIASGSVLLLFVAVDDVITGLVSLGTLVAFQRYITKMVWPMTALGMGYSQFQKGMASFKRIRNLFEQKSDIPDLGPIQMEKFEKLEIKNLSFKYPDSEIEVLKNISFDIKQGEWVGLVGPVGSGKTTLLHVINRLYPVEKNIIKINGHSVEEIKQSSLRNHFIFVPQEAFLFSLSIAENVAYGSGDSYSSEEIKLWTRIVNLNQEIENIPRSYEALLGERGVNLSGGQKQRLTIARALMRGGSFLILDDSLSAVDIKTELQIREALKEQRKDQTVLMVSHRLENIKLASKIIVLNEGQIEAIGTHAELLSSSPTYFRMASIQGVIS